MSRRLFVLPSVGAGDKVLIASNTGGTPAEILPSGGGGPVTGSILSAGPDGSLPRIFGPNDGTSTLYLLRLTYRGTITGSPTTLTGIDPGAATALATSPDVAAAIAADNLVEAGAYITVVSHGSTAGTARPTGAVRVFWLGSVQPTNAAQYDRWINTGVTPYTESIYNGSTWTALGGSGSVGPKTVTTVAASGATQTLALDTGNADRWYNVTLSANCAFTMPTPVVGAKLVLWLVQDATGNRTASWDSTVKWSAGAAPSLSSAAGKADRLEFECWKTGVWAGALTDLDSR